MLTNEKVLEVFREYLAADDMCEVVLTSRGYAVMQWNGPREEWYNVQHCATPKALRDALLSIYHDYLAYQYLGDEGDVLTSAQQEEIRQKYAELRERLSTDN